MSRSWPWQALATLGTVAFLAGTAWPAPSASAQTGVVRLALESQSAWNGPKRPLEIVVRATNDSSERLEQLSIALTIRTPARSRSAYELSLRADATSSFFTYPFVREGALGPGESRTFGLQQPLDLLTNRGESALYPLEIELRSDDAPLATLRSPMIFLIEPAKVPLSLAWTWIMAAPVDHGPDGVFLSDALESDLAPGGRLRAMAEALAGIDGVPATIAASSAFLDQLTSMADGYEVSPPGGERRTVAAGGGGAADASVVLGMLRDVAERPEIETLAYPFGDPSLPALFKAGLGKDFGPLLSRGRTLVREALGVSPSTTVIRPPFSHVDPGTLVRLVGSGARTVLLDQGLVPPPLDPTFSAPAVVRLSSGTEAVSAVVPDPGLPLVATAASADPRLAAHAALGWLAAMWFEFPGTPGRGAAVLFGEGSPHPAEFFEAFAPLVRSSPWLRPLAAEAFVEDIDPQGRAVLSPRSYPALDPSYVASVQRGKGQLRRFEDTLQDPDPITERLRAHLLLAEGGTFVARPDLGRRFVDAVSATIRRIYSRVTIPSQTFTLTSRSGVIPVQVRNDTGHELRVRVRLVSDRRLEFVDGDTATILLPPEDQIVRFAVSARTTGLLPIKVQIQTLGGDPTPDTISEAQVLVRSTAYNRVALFVTIGAALFLLAWWGEEVPASAETVSPGAAGSFVHHSAVMSVGTTLSRATGFLRVSAMAYALGVAESRLADAYQVANTTPNIIYELALGGILSSVFVPVFVEWLQTRGREAAWHTAQAVMTFALLFLGLVMVAGMIGAGTIVGLYTVQVAGPEREAMRALASFFLVFFMPQIVFYGVGAVATGLLNAHRRFSVPMFAPILNNVVVAATFFLFAALPGPAEPTPSGITTAQRYLLAVGTTLGVAAMTLALWPSLRRLGFRLRWTLDLRDAGLRRIGRLAGWAFTYVLINQVGFLVVIVFAGEVQGGVAAYTAAFILFQLPHAIFAVSIMTALLPSLSGFWAEGDRAAFRSQLSQGIRATAFIVVPAAFGYLALAVPIVRVLLQHGVAQEESTTLVAGVLVAFSAGLFSFSAFQLFLRAFYAMQDTRTPALIKACTVGLNIALVLVLFPRLRVQGLALAHAIAYTVAAVAAGAILRRRLGGLEGRRLMASLARVAIAGCATGAAAYLASRWVENALGTEGLPAQILQVGAALAAGGGAFLGMSALLRIEEMSVVRRLVGARFARSRDGS